MPVFYHCQRCTACCRWPGQVRLTEAEITRLAAHLGLGERDFVAQYTRLRADRRGLVLVEQAEGACIFLEGGDCRVQAVKPQQCRDFPNRWRFEGFREWCRAVPEEMGAAEYGRRVLAATGQPPVDAFGGGGTG